MRAFITGITGFSGVHLAGLLENLNYRVAGLCHDNPPPSHGFTRRVRLLTGDIRDRRHLTRIIRTFQPDQVYHLAGMSSVGDSLRSPADCFDVNLMGTLSLLESIRDSGLHPRVLLVGSGEEYGISRSFPLTESSPLDPVSPYGVSKTSMEAIGQLYVRAFGMPVVTIRAFNHTGPGQSPRGVCSDFARQIAEIEAGKKKPVLWVGNLKAKRDFSDVRDVVRGYWLAMIRGKPGRVYNLCSGQVYSIKEVLKILLSMSTKTITVRVREERLRPLDIPILQGSYARARRELAWSPEISFQKTLGDLLKDWKNQYFI